MRQFHSLLGSGLLSLASLLAVLTVPSYPAAAQDDPSAAAETPKDTPTPTASHVQTAIIKVTDESGQAMPLHTFCLNGDGKILAGVGAGPGQIRVYDADGNYVASWNTSIRPEAINVGPDGIVYVAGSGKVQKLDAEGNLLLEKPAPHAQQGKELEEKLRQQVIQQHKQQLEAYANYPALFRQQIAKFEEAIKQIDEKAEGERTVADENRRKLLQQQIEQYAETLKRYEEIAAQQSRELTDEQIQQQVQMMLDMKSKISSVSATATDVFLACQALEGYGFEVLRMNAKFEDPVKIITDLRGCCGQMDVQAGQDGVFVAENARFRVCRYDRDGEMKCEWGSREREGIDGFGSCCNPMNVAFGPDAEVYTAESTTGRIKRYNAEGELRGLVGSVEIVPGCKKVTIAVSSDGSRVYMLDMTRSHIVVMSRKAVPKTQDTAAK
ncbi:MAG: hypothetical protein KJ000_06145 [Pirellulaceae bacterium]|nr:hypothetical protein [Pirellulaceae bacterium]